jgi:UDPglucose 6-dehydrogenase
MDICVVGAGHVGLVTAAVFADLGNSVACVDVDQSRVEGLCEGRMPFFEPGLQEMVERNHADGRLTFTSDHSQAIPGAEVVFICVDTPPGPDGKADLSHISGAAEGIARHLTGSTLVVNKSTVPVGTGDIVREILRRHAPPEAEFEVVSCPEFLREGSAIADSLNPDRIIIGCNNQKAATKLLELYAPLERPVLLMDLNSAEMVKYASNSFLAARISFINSIADLCERMGADISQVIKGMRADERIGPHFLSPGLGYGGWCFPKDTEALAAASAAVGAPFRVLEAVIEVNRNRVPHFVARMKETLGHLDSRVIAVLGISFKPNTDDIREAKAIELIRSLLEQRALVRAYDPAAMPEAQRLLPQVTFCENPYQAAQGADALVVATEWNEFKLVDLARLRQLLRQPVVFDGRNVYSPERMAQLGFRYVSVGRPRGS